MNLKTQLDRFIKKAPFAVMTRGVITAMLGGKELTELFDSQAEQQYSRQISFMAVVGSMAEVALGTGKSKNQAYNEFAEEINASKTAYYNKLNRTELQLSEALVRFSAEKAQALLHQMDFQQWELLPGYRCYSIDGNHFGQSERRLKEARTLSAPPLPGTVVAKYDHQTGLFCDAYAMECGHAQENSVIDRVIAGAKPKEVYLADRLYCTKQFVFGFARVDAFFIVRQKMTFTGEPVGKRKRVGESETGVVFEQAVQVTQGEETRTIRRITVELFKSTRDGDAEIHLFTNLPHSVEALSIADAYRSRWEIETAFYQLTTTLCCESKGNCHPRCAILQFCIAMVAYNARRLLFAALYAVHDEEDVDNLSEFKISVQTTRHIEGLCVAVEHDEWQTLVGETPRAQIAFLYRIAKTIDPKRYKKSIRGPKKPPPEKKKMSRTSHLSAKKLLNQRKPPPR